MIGWMMKIIKDLKSNKVWQTEVSCVMWVWGKRMFDYSRPSDAPSAFVFGGCSSETPVGVDKLHMISFWRKSCLQVNYTPRFWKSFYPLVVSWFNVLLGCSNLWGWMLWFAKQCQLRLIRERSKWFDPHRFIDLVPCLD
jgi:hypothetical protein